jgi:hypothetical protein
MNRVVTFAALLALTGCASPPERNPCAPQLRTEVDRHYDAHGKFLGATQRSRVEVPQGCR